MDLLFMKMNKPPRINHLDVSFTGTTVQYSGRIGSLSRRADEDESPKTNVNVLPNLSASPTECLSGATAGKEISA